MAATKRLRWRELPSGNWVTSVGEREVVVSADGGEWVAAREVTEWWASWKLGEVIKRGTLDECKAAVEELARKEEAK